MTMQPFENPYAQRERQREKDHDHSNRERKKLNFFLSEEASKDFDHFYANQKEYLTNGPVFLPIGVPGVDINGNVVGVAPTLNPNLDVPLDWVNDMDPMSQQRAMRDAFYPSFITPLNVMEFVGPRIPLGQSKQGKESVRPSPSFIDEMHPDDEAAGMRYDTALQLLHRTMPGVVSRVPQWQQFLPPNRKEQFRHSNLPRRQIRYFVLATMFSGPRMPAEDYWYNPRLFYLPIRKSAYDTLMDLIYLPNPRWDASRVRTHADLQDPSNRPFAYDVVGAYGPAPALFMSYWDKDNMKLKPPHAFGQSGYVINVFKGPDQNNPGNFVPRLVSHAPPQEIARFMTRYYRQPKDLFGFMRPWEVIKIILEDSHDIEWSRCIEECMKGTDLYSRLEETFARANDIVGANNESLNANAVAQNYSTQPAQQQAQQSFQQPTQQYAPQQQMAPQYVQQQPQQMAPQYVQQPQQPVQQTQPPQQAGYSQQYQQPAPQYQQPVQQPTPQGTNILDPHYAPPAGDPLSTVQPGAASRSEYESQLMGGNPTNPPVQQNDPFTTQYGSGPVSDEYLPF